MTKFISTTPTINTPALELTRLSKTLGRFTVHIENLSIPGGVFYALLGPNGAGKTTTLRMISGLLQPDTGDAKIFGFNMTTHPTRAKQNLAYLPDEPQLYDQLTALEHLEFVAGLWGIKPEQAVLDAQRLLDQLGLWHRRADFCGSFSRGMKQKLTLAAALLHRPRLMILDEPLTGLDVHAARLVKDLLLEFVRDGGSIILTTHILEVAEQLAERIGVISGGRIIADGTLESLRELTGEHGTLESVFLELTRDQTVNRDVDEKIA